MMRKKVLHFAVLVVAFVMFFGSCFAVNAGESDEFETLILNIMEEKRIIYMNDPEFYGEAEFRGLSFEELLRQKAISTYQTRMNLGIPAVEQYAVGNNGLYLYANVPLIQQTSNYNCGPTAALQVLYGMSDQDKVEGQTDAKKIEKLEEDSGTNTSGTIVYRLTNTLNKYTSGADYEYILGSGMTLDQFQGKVETSLVYNTAPILHARTQYLPYYEGHKSGHYIAVSAVDNSTGTIWLQDCNYNNKYYGKHGVLIEEAFKTIHEESSRYLICMEY